MAIFVCTWTVLTIFLFIIQVTKASQVIPLLQYDMTTNDCERSTFSNGGILGRDSIKLIRNVSATACASGFGVESNFKYNCNETKISKALYTSKPIRSFMEELNRVDIPVTEESGLTLSLWIRPNNVNEYTCKNDDTTSSRTIFTIGWDTFSTEDYPPTGLTLCEKSKIDLQLSIIETDLFEIVYRTSDKIFEPCQRIEFNASSLLSTNIDNRLTSRPIHITISLGNYHQEVFVNGKAVARKREIFDVNLKHWNPMSLLEFFTYPTTVYYQTPPWDGQLLQFSIYTGILNNKLVKSVVSEGLAPSYPVAYPKVVHIYEDALDQNGTLQQIQMPFSFLDYEIDNLLSSLDLPHQPAAFVRHYITRFPTRGHLFHIEDGEIIEPVGNLPVLVNNMDRLSYIPQKDEHSDFLGHSYTSFDYCVTTKKIILSSQCTPVTISIVVDPINDPPVAIIPPVYYVREGIQVEDRALLLTGSDVDRYNFIQNIQITSLPKMGYLFLSVSSFRKDDNLLHGAILNTVNRMIPGKEVYVEYRFTDYITTTVQDLLVKDHFHFRVQDNVGSWSAEAKVEIHVVSSVFPSISNPNKWTVPMAKIGGTKKQLNGIDLSRLNRTLGFLMKSLPSTVIVLDEAGVPLVNNKIIESTKSLFHGNQNLGSANVTFVGIPSICDQNNSLLMKNILKYQVVALGLDKEVMSVSRAKEEEITIICRVEAVYMHVINQQGSMSLSAITYPTDDNCSGYMFDFKEESKSRCRETALIIGLQVDNAEKLIEPVYVVITASPGGFLSLNQKSFSNDYTILNQPVMRASIRLIVPAEKLTDVLSAIHFQSDLVGRIEIHIVLQYGRCDHNETYLIDNEFSASAIDCYKTHQKIYVNVQKNPEEYESSQYQFPWIHLLVIVVSGPIFYLKNKTNQIVEEIHAVLEDDGSIYDLPEVNSPENHSELALQC